MSGGAKWGRIGDWLFKSLVVCEFVYFIWGYAAAFRLFPQVKSVFPEWGPPLLFAAIGVEFLLIRLPWTIGMLMRRRWARQLWLIGALLGLSRPVLTRWLCGPFSPECSTEKMLSVLAGSGLVIALCISRPFKRYMDRQGGRIWFWIALGTQLAGVVGAIGLAVYWQGVVQKDPFQIVEFPKDSIDQPLPDGWEVAWTFGFSFPVPVGSTNQIHLLDDGEEWHMFRSVQGEETSRYALIQKQRAIYHSFPSLYGIESLEMDYRVLYEHHSLPSVLFRLAGQNFSHVGFQSMDGFDLVFGFRSVDGERDFIQVRLEDTTTGDYYEIWLQSTIPLSMEQRFSLISRIRRYGDLPAVVDKIIMPQITSISRNKGSEYRAKDFIVGEGREKFQNDLTVSLEQTLGAKGIKIYNALIRHVEVPDEIRAPIQQASIAIEQDLTNKERQNTARKKAGGSAEHIPPCPTCGKTMVLRTARNGENAGRQFRGCSGYPECNGVVDIQRRGWCRRIWLP